MSKMQQIWEESHPVKDGQVIPAGTEYIEAEEIIGTKVSGLSIYAVSNNIEVGSREEIFLRTLEPLPDTDDTGDADFYVYDDNPLVDSVDIGDVEVTRNQARNFARKLLEALNA